MPGTDARLEACSAAFGGVEVPVKCHIRQKQEQVWWHEHVAAVQIWSSCSILYWVWS